MDKNKIYSSKKNIEKEFKNNETNTYYLKKNLICDNDFISLINSLSSTIKFYYTSVTNIMKELKNNEIELNKYILTIKCLLNEMNNNKINIQERIKQFKKNIEIISINTKYINNNISSIEMHLNKLFNDSKIIFKRMKDFKKSKENKMEDIKININNNNQIMVGQNNINEYCNKNNNLKLSLDANKLNSFFNTNKSITNTSSSRRIFYTKKHKNENAINISQKNIKHKIYDLNLGDINDLENKLNKKKAIKKDNNYTKRNNSQNNILTNIPIYNLNKIKYLFESSPPKKRISTSTQKITPLCTNYNNYNNYYYYPNKYNKCPSSGNTTSRKYDNDYSSNYKELKTCKKMQINFDSLLSDNINNDNIIILLENIVEYFYLFTQYQYYIINNSLNNNDNNMLLKLKNSLINVNKLMHLNNDIFNNQNITKQRLFTIFNQNENIIQRLKSLISRANYNINYNEKNYRNNIN